MQIRTKLLAAIGRAAVAAEQLDRARRDVIAAMRDAVKAQQRATGRLDPPPMLSQARFDRELAHLLAAGGFVAPMYPLARPSSADFPDATTVGWSPRPNADTAATFAARWATRLQHPHLVID